ncbi:phosphoribosylaminoimidazolesuccinocarboxamide synthase [Jatrophihabitans sp. GAS493]|uniref:phosphoribosylaminoimidazolesuccinocarboxamide synthase n=1 Tax=Jatrophihabitans sp. GAS493 TaxID=1907575 RepID=UPI0018D55656|nr:phosphoribosylaminoimidazolesuccinocarboxamide synthase [Jatrophihabitans sp. GAS493]
MTELTHLHTGKVRDLYGAPDGSLVMVASDRISAYDFILSTPIPDKGAILTALSVWWFEQLADLAPNHLISVDSPLIPPKWRGRAMLCQSLEMVKVECVARGYLTGGGLTEYEASGSVCGLPLVSGLVDGSQLPEPIFTPTSKAAVGDHDESMTFDEVGALIGAAAAEEIRALTLAVYSRAAAIAAQAGVILADTKIELGRDATGRLVIADEVLTPDSSRFWPADEWKPGQRQSSYDKQFVRDWLTSPAANWDRRSGAEPPPLPEEIVLATRERYLQAYERLTGLRFADWSAAHQ